VALAARPRHLTITDAGYETMGRAGVQVSRTLIAWLDDDTREFDAIWHRIIEELGSDYDGYSYVSSISWAA
jgi:hypothetical protein